MELNALTGSLSTRKTECLAVAFGKDGLDNAELNSLDKASGGLIARLGKKGDIKPTHNNFLMISEPPGLAAQRLLIYSTGKDTLNEQSFLELLSGLAGQLTKLPIKSAAVSLEGVEVSDRDTPWMAQQLGRRLGEASYLFNPFKSADKKPTTLKKVSLLQAGRPGLDANKRALAIGTAIGNGINRARELGDLPGNICTPSYLATQAKNLAGHYSNMTCKVLTEKQMQDLGMGSLLSVTAGTEQPAKMIVLEYKGGTRGSKPVVLVGKGVTFDSGGISLKPGAGMDEMKYDMCGAASVFGTLSAAADCQLPLNVVGIIPTVENMPSGRATKPGDIVTSMSGQTIEILNTDAEGRLILCDALTYAGRYKPSVVVDIATLTGACVMALGSHASGLLSNDDPLAEQLETAGKNSGDRVWRLPLWKEYDKQLKSNFADMANIGGREAGTITAACFLGRFTKNYRWAHLDIAGTAWNSGANKGATGRPVPLLMQFLLEQAAQ
ncbi:leucyl aminopeptidase [Porticoccus litoralis]|uniref:Probable cytosol aminopeptidase n=1 Tax=Porticoccus litoralis TaxID=434086 RepID=A0AAW8B414_9GAMM|nr:leucyl aminopeptidase [Porticoccus litoralis]MDP1520451.1 leucyl aminopeptidase [Porticoccus litoralis]